jgi:hypothetical protein
MVGSMAGSALGQHHKFVNIEGVGRPLTVTPAKSNQQMVAQKKTVHRHHCDPTIETASQLALQPPGNMRFAGPGRPDNPNDQGGTGSSLAQPVNQVH